MLQTRLQFEKESKQKEREEINRRKMERKAQKDAALKAIEDEKTAAIEKTKEE